MRHVKPLVISIRGHPPMNEPYKQTLVFLHFIKIEQYTKGKTMERLEIKYFFPGTKQRIEKYLKEMEKKYSEKYGGSQNFAVLFQFVSVSWKDIIFTWKIHGVVLNTKEAEKFHQFMKQLELSQK